MAGFYSAADLFVLGSHHEGSGYALIEACACGTTPVVTDIPSFRAITGDGSIGALWPPGSASALAERLVAMSRGDRAARRRQVLDHFDRALSWASLGRQAVETYAGVVAAVRAGTR
jgi:glycosyltransferase involved in cell wall biosynthesis